MKKLMFTFALLFCSLLMLAQQAPVEKITVESFTRGYQKKINITPDSIFFQQSGHVSAGSRKEVRQALQPGEWEQLMKKLEGVKLTALPEMEVEGSNRARDAALHTTISLSTASEIYNSPTFDNYQAPSGLMALMEEIKQMEEQLPIKEQN